MKVIIHIGLDVHNDSIAVSLAPSDSTEVRRWGLLGGTHEHVQKLKVPMVGRAVAGPLGRVREVMKRWLQVAGAAR